MVVEILLYLILNIAGVCLLIFFAIEIYEKYISSNSFSGDKKKIHQTISILSLIIVLPFIIVKIYTYQPDLSTRKQRIAHYTKYKDYLALNQEYRNQLYCHSNNPKYHYNYVNSLNLYINELKYQSIDASVFSEMYEIQAVEEYYFDFISSRNPKKKNIGSLFLAIHYLHFDRNDEAKSLLDSVDKAYRNWNYYHYALGKYLRQNRDYADFEEAENHFKTVISSDVFIKEAYDELAILYFYFRENDKLRNFVKDERHAEHIDSFFHRIVNFRDVNIFAYFKTILQYRWGNTSFLGIVSSLLILLLWLFYLRKLNIYHQADWKHSILTIGLSMLCIYLAYPIHDILRDVFEYYMPEGKLNVFFYDVITIGLVEEFVKTIPVLIILFFTKAIKEPYDYIYYFCLSALGFAFIENTSYIQESSLYNIGARAFFSTVAHMFFSATVGYGLMISKFKKLGGTVFFILLFLFLAALFHGFYNYWLLHYWNIDKTWITVVFFIICVHFLHIYINNAMNISTDYRSDIIIDNLDLRLYLVLVLSGIFMWSFLANTMTRGANYGFILLFQSAFLYFYFILFFTFSFSRFIIVRGYMRPLFIPLTLLIPYKVKKPEDLSGNPLFLEAYKFTPKSQFLYEKFPMEVQTERRIVVDNSLQSYLVSFDNPLNVEGFLSNQLVIIPKSYTKTLANKGRIFVSILLIPTDFNLDKAMISSKELQYIGWGKSKRIDNINNQS